MRYTVIDREGPVSFVAECLALSPIVAACAKSPADLNSFLTELAIYEPPLAEYVSSGLAVFDEHNGPDRYEPINTAIATCRPHQLPVFRVVNEATRQASLQPVKYGVVLFNLAAHRIVQIQNTWHNIEREGKVLARRPWKMVRHYKLPAHWSLVP